MTYTKYFIDECDCLLRITTMITYISIVIKYVDIIMAMFELHTQLCRGGSGERDDQGY